MEELLLDGDAERRQPEGLKKSAPTGDPLCEQTYFKPLFRPPQGYLYLRWESIPSAPAMEAAGDMLLELVKLLAAIFVQL